MKMTPEKIEELAYLNWWYRTYKSRDIDLLVEPYLDSRILGYKAGRSWLREAREANLLSMNMAAEKMQVSRSAYQKFEAREAEGKISLETLAKAAESIGCELVYAVRPKHKERFSMPIWRKLSQIASKHPWFISRPLNEKWRILSGQARMQFEDSEFRKEQGWSERIRT